MGRFKWAAALLLAAGLGAFLLLHAVPFARAAGNNVAICTEAALDNALAVGGSITFTCSGAITITTPKTIAVDTSLDGKGTSVAINGGDSVRLFSVNAGVTLTVRNLTLTHGSAPGSGGALLNNGTLSLFNTTLSYNRVTGAILTQGGGAIFNSPGATLTLTNSSVVYNIATSAPGGGVVNRGTATIGNSTIGANRATGIGDGGGLYNDRGTLTIINTTISENVSNFSYGAGISNVGGTVTIKNTIIAGNKQGKNCGNGGIWNATINNRADDLSCLSFITVNPGTMKLGPLEGVPPYYPLLQGSPAIDVGDNPTCGAPPINGIDQQGEPRPKDGFGPLDKGPLCDIGSIEFKWPPPPVPLCADLDGTKNPIVRAKIPANKKDIYCRVLAAFKVFRENSAAIGNEDVLNRGVIHAVDIFSLHGNTAQGSLICLYGTGSLIFLDSANAPRVPQWMAVTIQGQYSCATIPNTGTLVMVADSSGAPPPTFLDVGGDPVIVPLTGCKVTTTHMDNLRENPNRLGSVLTIIPWQITLNADQRAPGNWYHVIFENYNGWVNGRYVSTDGSC